MIGAEIVKRWSYRGKDCVILRMPNLKHYCIYVETDIKIGYNQHDDLSPCSCISVHGGITYAGALSIDGAKPWYFGADFAHYGDCIEGFAEDFGLSQEGHVWTIVEVVDECERFADSVIEYEKRYRQIFELFERIKEDTRKLKESMR